MSSPKFTISHKAYTKVIVHAAKYPHAPVNGVLIGKASTGNGTVLVEDAIPLLHEWTSLSPMMEIGLDMARTHAESMGMTLLGYYQATQRLDDTEGLSPVGQRIASNLKDKYKDAFALVVDSVSIASTTTPPLIPYTSNSSQSWSRTNFSPTFALADPDSPARALEIIRKDSAYASFGDFDDHLQDVSVDWLRGGLWGEEFQV
ncbi:hypothetical protein RhiJN_23620 [Ceratobasidium sp. AG-Ba]|nr:hypothetical protein RhiJN_23620 [Ceratobasidium sp. AG-Ba]